MKKLFITIVFVFFIATACSTKSIKEPKILIDRATMIDILYDLSVLEAMRSINASNSILYPKPTAYIQNNYKYDSLTFAQNSKFYASNSKDYKKMYDEVKERLQVETAKLSSTKKQIEAP